MNKQLSHGHQSNGSSGEGRGISLGWAVMVNYIKEMDLDGKWRSHEEWNMGESD